MAPSKNRHAVARNLLRAGYCAVTLVARSANAEPPRFEAPRDIAECPSSSELRSWIAAQLGRDDFDRSDAPSVNVRVRRSSDGTLAADVSVTTSMTSTRTIDDADSCVDLVRAAALSVALALEKDAAREKTPTPAATPEVPREGARAVGAPIRADRVVLTASGLTTVGLLPRPAAGAGIGARVRVSDSVWVSGRAFWLPEAPMPNGAFDMNVAAAAAGACAEPVGTEGVVGTLCAHLLAGAFGVTKAHVDMGNTAPEPYVAATVSVGARARVVGPLQIEGALDGQLPLTRPTYLTTTCPPSGFQPPFMALALWLGAAIAIR